MITSQSNYQGPQLYLSYRGKITPHRNDWQKPGDKNRTRTEPWSGGSGWGGPAAFGLPVVSEVLCLQFCLVLTVVSSGKAHWAGWGRGPAMSFHLSFPSGIVWVGLPVLSISEVPFSLAAPGFLLGYSHMNGANRLCGSASLPSRWPGFSASTKPRPPVS